MSVNVKSAGDPLGLGTEPATITTDVPADSIVGKLRARTQAQQAKKTKAFPVGGEFGDWLQIRYEPLVPDVLDEFLIQQEGVTQLRAIQMNMDMMSRACVAIEGFDPVTEERTVLRDDANRNILLDNRLAVLLNMPNESGQPLTAREVITILFGRNGLAIGQHGDDVTEWMRAPRASSGN